MDEVVLVVNSVLAFAALVLGLANYARGRPGVTVRGGRAAIAEWRLSSALTVRVRSGRSASVTIEFWGFEIHHWYGRRRRAGGVPLGIAPKSVPKQFGPEYPHRLDPGDQSVMWAMAVDDLGPLVGKHDRLRAYVLISTRDRPVKDEE